MINPAPDLTVLMSVYNGRDHLAEAVESILNQTFSDFRFLIIDDGSAEPCADIVNSFRDPRIELVRQENVGLTRSLNRGLSMAETQYVARMDADDVSLPERLGLEGEVLRANPEIDLVGSHFSMIDGTGRLIETKELITDPVYRLWRLQFHNTYGHGTVMFRRDSVIDLEGYDESLPYSQDYDLWWRLSQKTNTHMIDQVLYQYRLESSGEQASVKNYDRQLDIAVGISDRNLKACNPELTDWQCVDIRALYWNFQKPGISAAGLDLLPATLSGFSARYGLDAQQQGRLARRVILDAIQAAEVSPEIRSEERGGVVRKLMTIGRRK